MNNGAAYAVIRQAARDPEYLRRLTTNPEEVLSESGLTEPEQRKEVAGVMATLLSLSNPNSPMTGGYQAQYNTTLQTAESFMLGLQDTVKQIERGYRSTMLMYIVAFYLGVALIAAAIAMAFIKERSLLPIVFGSLGIADVLAYFITKPPQDLQFSRARLAQLQAAFFHWFFDYTNWNGVLLASAKEGRASLDLVKTISAILMANTEKTMSLIDSYCGSPRQNHKTGAE